MSKNPHSLSRRNFLKAGSFGTLAGVMIGSESRTQEAIAKPPIRPAETVKCAVIGFGLWGREIAQTLGRLEEAELVTVCDNYPIMLRRAERSLPGVSTELDYRAVLDDPAVMAVFVATPSHLHKQIVLDALSAGKHVYCEAPLASSIEDARAIALAAREADGLIFQGGLLYRTEPQYRDVFRFIRSGAVGTHTMARAQWHAKDSWYRTSPDAARTNAQNWRLDPEISAGLLGEVGIQQLDTAMWIYDERPKSVTGFGGVYFWPDREVADTAQTVFDFPSGQRMVYDASLVTSFDGMYDSFYGSTSTIVLRDGKAWMFKEVDAPILGWEVYARKDKFYTETGVALVANATKIDAAGLGPTDDLPGAETPLFHALKAFMDNYFFGPFQPIMNYQKSFDATVVALKANEAVVGNTKIEYRDEWFEL